MEFAFVNSSPIFHVTNNIEILYPNGSHSLVMRKVTLLVFRVHCGILSSSQSEECERVMEFPLRERASAYSGGNCD